MPGLRATLDHARAAHYRRPGGPWDRGGLDVALGSGRRAGVVDDHVRLDPGELRRAVDAVGAALLAAGAVAGDVVAWQLPNTAAVVVLYRACWRIGCIAAPLHHRLGGAEVEAALAQVSPRLVLAASGMPAADLPGTRLVAAPVTVASVVETLGPGASLSTSPARVDPADIAVALFTSGSTGIPKAVLHTHQGLGYKAALMAAAHGLTESDAVLMPAPLAHVSGLLNGVLLPAAAGIPSVLMASWDPELALERIESERVSFMGAPPIFFSQMATAGTFRPERVASLRLVSTGGASVSPAFVDSTAAAFDCRVKRTYGSTEAPTMTTSGPDDSPDKARETDGRIVGEAELEIHDPDTGAPVAIGSPGEIWLRGPELFVGYADPAHTAKVVGEPGSWYRSGDIGVLDGEGWLRVVGRLSDIIIRAGENISASEVEAVLEAHPAVRHAVAVPVPDEALGERVAAFVETSARFDLDECRRWFESRGVTRFKTPEFVVVVDELPVLAAGKPDRAAMRARAAGLGRSQG
ncbi:MAG: class I adenylate-forming enzyme family protein [Acidimicrobiales bacterium]